MAGQGLPTTPTETIVTKQYIRTGQNDSTPNSYIEISVTLARFWEGDYSSNTGQDYAIRNERRAELDPDDNGWIADTSKIRFKFIRKRDNGFKISYSYNENNGRHFITIEYDGGKNNETLGKLKKEIRKQISY